MAGTLLAVAVNGCLPDFSTLNSGTATGGSAGGADRGGNQATAGRPAAGNPASGGAGAGESTAGKANETGGTGGQITESGGSSATGGDTDAGGAGNAGGVTAGSGGTGGQITGSGGSSATGGDTGLALNAPVTVSSEQPENIGSNLTNGNVDADKWCASVGAFPQFAILDLGATAHTLTSISVDWEQWDVVYQYTVEVSNTANADTDPAGATWVTAADQTTNLTTYRSGHTSDPLVASGRFLRLTVTATTPNWAWACAWEVMVSGY